MNSPQNSQIISSNLIKWQPPRQDLPKDHSPTESVTFLGVGDPFEDLGGHPGGTTFVIGHDSLFVTSRAKIANFQHQTSIEKQQIWRLQISMDQRIRFQTV